jgi:hypothetical protein
MYYISFIDILTIFKKKEKKKSVTKDEFSSHNRGYCCGV